MENRHAFTVSTFHVLDWIEIISYFQIPTANQLSNPINQYYLKTVTHCFTHYRQHKLNSPAPNPTLISNTLHFALIPFPSNPPLITLRGAHPNR